jgi:type IV secretory pathway VirJ component
LWYPLVSTAAEESSDAPAKPVIEMEVMEQAGFGKVSVRVPPDDPKGVVLLLTGSAGPDAQLNKLADDIAGLNYVVASIDSNSALFQKMGSAQGVHDVTTRLLELNKTLADKHDLDDDMLPLIAGYGSGGTHVYEVLAQAAANSFHAGISLDFCPGADADALKPAAHLATTWFVFQHAPACNAEVATRFVQAVSNARLDDSASVEENPASAQRPWASALSILQWLDPSIDDQLQADEKVPGVPLIEIPAEKYHPGGRMVVLLSGDGGWAELDSSVSAKLSELGFSVVGWDSLSYFWRAKTPEQAGSDLVRVLRRYQQLWQPGKISLVGYSFGANVLPFMANHLPSDLRALVDRIVLLSPEQQASFEFHLSSWVNGPAENTVPLLPELSRLRWTNVLCISGDTEDSDTCRSFAAQGVSVASLPGNHHFDEDYPKLAKRIVQDWPGVATAEKP